MVNISYIRVKGKIVDNYTKTLKGWANKDVEWCNIHKVMSNDSIQYSPYMFKNGYKKKVNCIRDKQNTIVLDIDDGLTIKEFQSMFSNYTYCLVTTKSHQKIKHNKVLDRFRVVFKAINIPSDINVYFRTLEILAPFNDEQTLTGTASFLGNDGIVIYNSRKILDLHNISLLAKEQLKNEVVDNSPLKKHLYNSHGSSDIDELKNSITYEIVVDILHSIGIEVVGNKCALREERTMSTKIYNNGTLYDFGTCKHYDIFSILMEFSCMDFKSSMNYVRNFI